MLLHSLTRSLPPRRLHAAALLHYELAFRLLVELCIFEHPKLVIDGRRGGAAGLLGGSAELGLVTFELAIERGLVNSMASAKRRCVYSFVCVCSYLHLLRVHHPSHLIVVESVE
jgi:hypothetical protein